MQVWWLNGGGKLRMNGQGIPITPKAKKKCSFVKKPG